MTLCDGLQIGKSRLVVLHVGYQHIEVANRSRAVVRLYQIQRLRSVVPCFNLRLQCLCIVFQRPQGIGNLFECPKYRLSVASALI